MPCHSFHVQLAVDFVEWVVAVGVVADTAGIQNLSRSLPNRVYYAYDDSDEQVESMKTIHRQPTRIFSDRTVDIRNSTMH